MSFIINDKNYKSESEVYAYFGRANTPNEVSGKCPKHKDYPVIWVYENEKVKATKCASCKGSIVLKKPKPAAPTRKITMREIGINKCKSLFYSESSGADIPNKIIFCQTQQGGIYPVKLTGKRSGGTFECKRISDHTLKSEIQAHLGSAKFSPADIENIKVHYAQEFDSTVHSEPSYINGESKEFNLTYKLFNNHINLSDNLDACPVWKSFVDRISDGEAFAAFIWSVFESKHIGRQMLYLQGGEGEEGKSILANSLINAIGANYSVAMKPNDFSTSSNFGLSKAEGKRLILIPDVNNEKLLKYDGLKQVLGGDYVTIENKYENAYSTRMNSRVFASSNYPLSLSGHNFETSRLLWLEIVKMGEFIHDVEEKLVKEFDEFLKYCKWCYKKRCVNHYKIISEDSEERMKDSIDGAAEDVLANYEQYFSFDEGWNTTDSRGWFISRKVFNAKIKLIKPNISNKEISEIKNAIVSRGFHDLKKANGYKRKVDGKTIATYRGIKLSDSDLEEIV